VTATIHILFNFLRTRNSAEGKL